MTQPVESNVQLLDCTLRDGSYAVNFQFTRRDTSRLCEALDRAGVPLIEVGHGMGLGASSPQHGLAYESDCDYLQGAAEAVQRADWGAFFIPGIGTTADIRNAADHGADFLRIGSEVDSTHRARSSADFAHSSGMDIYLNLMKTYAMPLAQLAHVVREIDGWNICKAIYVVDSAGCMTPDEVAAYTRCVKDNAGCGVGFHGHNNLDLANANSLAAVAAGATYVDSTIRGIGRSAGNAQTEILAFLLARRGHIEPCDLFSLFEIGERVIAPLNIQTQGLPPLDIVIGMARFHTSHLQRLRRAADEHCVDLRRLIIDVSRLDCVAPSDALIEATANDLSRVEPGT